MGFESPQTDLDATTKLSIGQVSEPRRIIFFYNPFSRGGANYEQDLEQLRHTGLEVDPYKTSPHIEDNAAVLTEVSRAGDVVAWLGGDGTLGNGLSAARRAGSLATHLAIPRGRKNDLAAQLIGKGRSFHDPTEVIDNGTVMQLYPLTASFVTKDGAEDLRDIWVYCGIGASAWASAIYNHEWYRQSRLHRLPGVTSVVERAIAVGSLLTPPVTVIDHKTPDTPHRLTSRIIAWGDRMGGELKLGAQLFELSGRLIDAHQLNAALVAGRLMLGHQTGRVLEADEVLSFTVKGRGSRTAIRIQTGGEVTQYDGPVEVTIERPPDSVSVYTMAG